MDSSTHKRYHEDNFDSRQHLESYLSDKADMIPAEDSLIFPIENLTKKFYRGDQLQDKEGKVRSALQHIVKCNLEKEYIIDPIVLPPADCIISAWLQEIISKDKDDYIRYLRKFLKLLKPGGHIIIISSLEMTYYTIGNHKFHGFNHDEDFVRKALVGEGLIVDRCKVKKRTDANDYIDYKAQIFIAAHKEI
ncbi:indolethylamine N-methyltransferase-like [Ranitomeya variabilis]|uniref:indolethylamine N-methyltransferase-like n=1 Tax=Ranitomeya variabilis TaxID=490064 RepID=UPI004056E847